MIEDRLRTTLLSHPSVKEAVVSLHTTKHGRRLLIAWYTTVEGSPVESTSMFAYMRSSVGPNDALNRVFYVDTIDQLVQVGRPRPQLDTPYEAPRNATEELIADIWAQVLEVEEVGRLDDFYELGADSLAAVEAIVRIEELMRPAPVRGVPFEIAAMDARTVADLARLVDGA